MKLDKLFQSLLLTGAVIVFITTPAKGEEVREDIQGESSTATVGKSTLDEKVTVIDKEFAIAKSLVDLFRSRKNRLKESQIASSPQTAKSDQASKNIPQLSEIELSANTARMLVQTPTPTNSPNPEQRNGDQVVLITGVKTNPTDKGVEVILETPQGTQLQVTNRSTGNNFIADVSGGQLRLPSGKAFAFRSDKPLEGITQVTVTNIDANTVRVTVVGEKTLPTVELFDDNAGLVFGISTIATATSPPQQPQTPQAQEKPALPAPPTPTNPPNSEQTSGDQVVPITGVKASPTDKGVEVILETPLGTQLQVTNRSTGNNFIADVFGGQLRLPSGEAFTFRSEKPTAEIAEIIVTNINANTVRVTVVGEKALPTVELFDDDAGLVFGVIPAATATQPPQQPQTPQAEQKPENQTPQQQPAAQEDEPIELVVTGEQDGYNVPDASTATRTDTPIRDIPQSIQIVPRQVIEDRDVRNLNEALETVSGVTGSQDVVGAIGGGRIIRGFTQIGNFRNGLPQGNEFYTLDPIGTIEQVEVLKGPASVLFGSLEPGGIVNTVTRQPLSDPYYRLEFQAGNRNFYQSIIDFSGPLTTDKKVLYRLIAGYEVSDGFQEFVNGDQVSVAPSITVNFSERTNLNLYYEYSRFAGNPPFFSNAIVRPDGSFLTPRNFFSSYPDTTDTTFETQKLGYTLKHSFSDNLQLRNSLAIKFDRYGRNGVSFGEVRDDRFLVFSNGTGEQRDAKESNYFGQIDLLGKFNTGSISHQVLVGFDANRYIYDAEIFDYDISSLPDLDILNPNYDVPTPSFINSSPRTDKLTAQSYGVYLQDQIALSDNLKLLIGGRYDWVSDESEGTGVEKTQLNDSAFSPRIGLVYQPSKAVSLYASYSRSFKPSTFALQADGARNFKPTTGTQYEVGVKADFLDGRLSTTLAAYHLTKTNVITPDPDPILAAQGFSVQTGEQRSQGIELDIAGEILPGWRVIGSYTYTDAEVTKDNSIPVGNRSG